MNRNAISPRRVRGMEKLFDWFGSAIRTIPQESGFLRKIEWNQVIVFAEPRNSINLLALRAKD
jgi:hypothetical protein